MKYAKLALCFVLVALAVAGCGASGSPFDIEFSGAMTFEPKAITFGPNDGNDYGVLSLFDVNPDVSRPAAVGQFTIYGLQANGVGDYALDDVPGGSTNAVVNFTFFTADMEGSFSYNPAGTFSVTAFDGTKMSCTFDFVVDNETGQQLRVRGTLTDIPFNDTPFTG